MTLHQIQLKCGKASNFTGKSNMTFHQVAYNKTLSKMKFYYDRNDLARCYSLLPLPQFGENFSIH